MHSLFMSWLFVQDQPASATVLAILVGIGPRTATAIIHHTRPAQDRQQAIQSGVLCAAERLCAPIHSILSLLSRGTTKYSVTMNMLSCACIQRCTRLYSMQCPQLLGDVPPCHCTSSSFQLVCLACLLCNPCSLCTGLRLQFPRSCT